MDYLLPTATDVPVIEYGHVETPSPGPGGYKGVGEGGAIGVPPAVANAVADAPRAVGREADASPGVTGECPGHDRRGARLVTTASASDEEEFDADCT